MLGVVDADAIWVHEPVVSFIVPSPLTWPY